MNTPITRIVKEMTVNIIEIFLVAKNTGTHPMMSKKIIAIATRTP
jgi:hypothetical protein